MANWCEGTLKIRSENKENILNFIKDSFMDCCHASSSSLDIASMPAIESGVLEIDDNDDWIDISLDCKEDHWIHIANCGKSFIELGDFNYYETSFHPVSRYYDNSLHSSSVVVFPFKSAWTVDPENWIEASRKYNVDFRMYGVERNNEFVKEVEIIKGEVTLDKKIEFDDWDWQCPFPKLGG